MKTEAERQAFLQGILYSAGIAAHCIPQSHINEHLEHVGKHVAELADQWCLPTLGESDESASWIAEVARNYREVN